MMVELEWAGQMHFVGKAAGQSVDLDAHPPIGQGKGMTPKEMLLCGLAGCTAMDVAALLRKHRQVPEHIRVRVEATQSTGKHPHVFTEARLLFEIGGSVDPQVALQAVVASQSTFCGVSAMLSRAFPIAFDVQVNGVSAGSGQASFPTDDASAAPPVR